MRHHIEPKVAYAHTLPWYGADMHIHGPPVTG